MIYQEDYIMRIISNLINFLARVIFGKENPLYQLSENEEDKFNDELHKELLLLLGEGKINEAENKLFENLNPKDKNSLRLALDFYKRLNSFDDKFLKDSNFSRKEIEEGLKDLAKRSGISIYGL